MKLREHPGMTYHGLPNWPPVWTRARSGESKTMRGEVGKLNYVYANCAGSTRCYLVIDCQGEQYIGCLLFSDRSFCAEIARLLQGYTGYTVEAIGDLDLSYSL